MHYPDYVAASERRGAASDLELGKQSLGRLASRIIPEDGAHLGASQLILGNCRVRDRLQGRSASISRSFTHRLAGFSIESLGGLKALHQSGEAGAKPPRSEQHTSEPQSHLN